MADPSLLLLLDFQAGVLAGLGDAGTELAVRVAEAMDTARSAGVPLVHVRTAFRPGYPEVSDRNALFSSIRAGGRLLEGGADTDFALGLEPRGEEAVITKHRIDAFWATDLDVVLGAMAHPTLFLAGIVTSGAVLSAVRSAANRDHSVVVIGDCCGDRDQAVHDTLMTRVFPMTARVSTAADAATAWG